MQQALIVLSQLLTNLLTTAPLDTVTRAVAIGHVSRVMEESERWSDVEDSVVELAVTVRCLVLLTQLQGLLADRADYPNLLQDVEAQVAAEQLAAAAGIK